MSISAPFRRSFKQGANGLDVLAVKRALKKAGFGKGITLGRHFGAVAARDLKSFQHAHSLKADGVYGPATHKKLLSAFDKRGEWLYNHGPKPATYVAPFKGIRVQAGRIDQGVDYHGIGPIAAIGNAQIIGNGGGGWPGGNFLLYRLLDGEHKGRYIYVAESIIPKVKAGQHVKAGQTIAYFGLGALPGRFPGIETGWGTHTLNLTRAAQMGNTGGPGHSYAPAGLAFTRFLRRLGTPVVENPGRGPEYV